MSLGFGPSLEHEIVTSTDVVDLLISFCHSSAYGRRLRDLPTGMALSVPRDLLIGGARSYKATFDERNREVIFGTGNKPLLQIGNWIKYKVVTSARSQSKAGFHARVVDVRFLPGGSIPQR